MGYEANVLRRASAILEEQRRAREAQARQRLERACAQQPRLRQIDVRLRQGMLELCALPLRREGETVRSVEEIRAENTQLRQQRRELLSALGLTEAEVDGTPRCGKCGDSGWRGTQMCSCLQALCAQEQIRELSKLLDLGEQSFDTFRLDYYSDRMDTARGASPRENMEIVRDTCWAYAQKFGRFYLKNLYLSGPPGLGKTFLSACIARTVSERGSSVVYDSAVNIFSQFEVRKFRREGEDLAEAKDETRRYLSCDLLILDDLGSEMTTQFIQSALYELINARLISGRHTVISSNLAIEDLSRRYLPQIVSRIVGEYHVLRFFGEDIRVIKKQRL